VHVENIRGEHFKFWMWPLDSPETAVCGLGMAIPAALRSLTGRASDCLALLAQGLEVQVIAEQ
jgi:DNA-binding NarL/FixJ family response regulator